MPGTMKAFDAQRWGSAMSDPARKWAQVLAPDTAAALTPPKTLMLIFDYAGNIQGWMALWPLKLNRPEALRIVKIKGEPNAAISNTADSSAMTALERHARTLVRYRRYWLVYNSRTKRYEDFKEAG